jgi:EmrB/QacA subfamily drug resistance transporter
MIMSTIDGTIVATALPTIAADLGNEELRSWVITTYLLALVATMPLYGKLGDLYGRKRVYVTAISIFTVGSALCGAAGSMQQLLAARFVQGIGAGGIGALAMAIVADIVPARQLGRWLGYQGAIFAVASLIGPLTGGLFVDNLSWHWAFYVNLPFAAASIFIVVTQLKVPYQRVRHSLDVLGAILLTAGLACVVLAASIGGRTNDWTSLAVLALAAGVVVLSTLFVLHERGAPEPVLPFRLMRQKVVRYAAGLNAASGATFASGIYFIPVFVQQVQGLSATESGFLLVPFMFTTAFTTLLAGRAVERTGRYRAWPIVGSVIVIAAVAVLTTLGLDTPAWLIAVYGAFLGAGVGFVMQTSLRALQNGADRRDTGGATSSARLARLLGSTLGVAVCSAALQSQLPDGPATAAGYAGALPFVYYAALPVTIVMLVLAMRLPQLSLREDARFDFDPPGDAAVAH